MEGLATYLKNAELMWWMNNENGDGVKAVTEFLGVMIMTTFDMLKEHNLFVASTEETKIKNLQIMSLMLLEFLLDYGQDLDQEWGCEIVRYFDEAGIDLEKSLRKQVSVSKKQIEDYRSQWKEKKEASDLANDGDNGDGYTTFEKKKDWKPADDINDYERKMFYRWDWEKEVSLFELGLNDSVI